MSSRSSIIVRSYVVLIESSAPSFKEQSPDNIVNSESSSLADSLPEMRPFHSLDVLEGCENQGMANPWEFPESNYAHFESDFDLHAGLQGVSSSFDMHSRARTSSDTDVFSNSMFSMQCFAGFDVDPPTTAVYSVETGSPSPILIRSLSQIGASTASSPKVFDVRHACPRLGCAETFRRPYEIKRHVRTIHDGRDRCYCPVSSCSRSQERGGKAFNRIDRRDEHVKRRHGYDLAPSIRKEHARG
ncbi:MAG: hypothetical protein M1820_009683 [Bogoriella megaspora]|nr:MAG: hypothetical protein M1820_009683 [Bogoriella megaspora]